MVILSNSCALLCSDSHVGTACPTATWRTPVKIKRDFDFPEISTGLLSAANESHAIFFPPNRGRGQGLLVLSSHRRSEPPIQHVVRQPSAAPPLDRTETWEVGMARCTSVWSAQCSSDHGGVACHCHVTWGTSVRFCFITPHRLLLSFSFLLSGGKTTICPRLFCSARLHLTTRWVARGAPERRLYIIKSQVGLLHFV